MRARGLKRSLRSTLHAVYRSRPMRARGLKPPAPAPPGPAPPVAPHAGAWIETAKKPTHRVDKRPSRPMRARGLKLRQLVYNY